MVRTPNKNFNKLKPYHGIKKYSMVYETPRGRIVKRTILAVDSFQAIDLCRVEGNSLIQCREPRSEKQPLKKHRRKLQKKQLEDPYEYLYEDSFVFEDTIKNPPIEASKWTMMR